VEFNSAVSYTAAVSITAVWCRKQRVCPTFRVPVSVSCRVTAGRQPLRHSTQLPRRMETSSSDSYRKSCWDKSITWRAHAWCSPYLTNSIITHHYKLRAPPDRINNDTVCYPVHSSLNSVSATSRSKSEPQQCAEKYNEVTTRSKWTLCKVNYYYYYYYYYYYCYYLLQLGFHLVAVILH
jgi:hypothetical protein